MDEKNNTGNLNTGDRNTGDLNTGHWNTGNLNTGDWNTGNWNTGNLNTGNLNTGFFCTETPSPTFFDRPTNLSWEEACNLIPYLELSVGVEFVESKDMTDAERIANPNHVTVGGFLRPHNLTIQRAFSLAWAKADKATRQRFLDLPNFDAEKFLACTGVDVRKPEPAAEIVVDGVTYVRKE